MNPYNIAKALKEDYGVTTNWKTIGSELLLSPDLMGRLARKQNNEAPIEEILTAMFEEVKRSHPDGYETKIRDALKETGCESALETLNAKADPGLKKPPQQSFPDTRSIRAVEDTGSPNTRDVIDFVVSVEPLKIKVKQGANYGTVKQGSYMLTGLPRGYVLIVNNIIFTSSSKLKPRKGAENDTTYLKDLFAGLNLNIEYHENVSSSKDLDLIIDAFRRKCILCKAKACVVVICSHGERDIIYSSNGNATDIYDGIVYKFKNGLDPTVDENIGLKDIPKIFIFQACQGKKRYEHDEVPSTRRNGVIADTVVCYSTIPHYVSNRDKFCGTWFITALAKVMSDHACDMHFIQMLEDVQKVEMPGIKNEDDVTQICTWSPFLFNDFYFNPKF